jgi:hypothetical protein
MTPKITNEMRQALRDSEGQPVTVEDEETRRIYVLVARDEFCRLADDELRRQLQIGFDQADRGESGSWNADEIKAEGRRRLSQTAPKQ